MGAEEWRRDGFVISTDASRLDRDMMWGFIGQSYWGKRFDRETFDRSVDGSMPFGLYDEGGAQIGFVRAVTDGIRFAWLSDLFVLPAYQGKGLGRWLVDTVIGCPALSGMDRWMLATDDAHGFYGNFGFGALQDAERYMVRRQK
jgi:GNAT superfamily N-acetyltransferase